MYKSKCPKCDSEISFDTGRRTVTDKDIDERVSLRLHGKTTVCGKCKGWIKIRRVKNLRPVYGIDLRYRIPVYDGEGNILGSYVPGNRADTWRDEN